MMKNLNGRAHNACYHPYLHQLHQAQQQQQQQQHQHQQQTPHAAHTQQNALTQNAQPQMQWPYNAAAANQYYQQQQQQLHHQQQQQQQQEQQMLHQRQLPTQQPAAATNTNAAAMAAMCQMQNFFTQQQQQQQQEFNNNCGHINYNQPQQQQQQQQQQPTPIKSTPTNNPPTNTSTTANGDKFAMDASEIASFLASELFMQQLGTFDGIQSAPTLTTPTLTPTTMRSIEEIYEMTNDVVNAPYQAGFKPPPLAPLVSNNNGNGNGNNGNGLASVGPTTVTIIGVSNPLISQQQQQQQVFDCGSSVMPGSDSEESNGSWADGQINEDQSISDTSSGATDSTSYQNGHMMSNSNGGNGGGGANNFSKVLAAAMSSSQGNTNTSNSATPARRGGGRRPNRSANMTPEEEEKRRIRRERNKQAAARCRKRRVDQTNELTEEVELLEKRGESLKKEMELLNETKNQLEYFLQAHRPACLKVRADMLSVSTCNGIIGPAALLSAGSCGSGSSHHNNNSNSNDSSSGTITGLDATLNSTGRSNSPLDLKPVPIDEDLLLQIKDEPLDGALDSSSSLDQDGPPPHKRCFALPNIATLMTPTGPTGSLQTPISGTAPHGFGSFPTTISNIHNGPTLNTLNKMPKERPNTLAVQRPFGGQMQLSVSGGKAPTQIQGVPIQTPSTGTFNFDSLMDGGTGLTPVSGPLVPNCSSQNKHPLELPTPTTEPSKLVSL
ncbi:transcription factor kayak [Drosophila madeirensis]|uniref:Transcription factor kayak n=1 Tax=Drosophila madeirensis TaxID=30013 RepID=A0AAU9EYI5_DROMD